MSSIKLPAPITNTLYQVLVSHPDRTGQASCKVAVQGGGIIVAYVGAPQLKATMLDASTVIIEMLEEKDMPAKPSPTTFMILSVLARAGSTLDTSTNPGGYTFAVQ